ncbi:MAG: hypothetical protein WBJ41_03380 [Chromatiaceae bacterium]
MKTLISHLTEKQREGATVLLVFGLLLAVFHGIYGRFFPTAQGTLGHDIGLAFASMLDGYIWFAKNGMWEVPWFSPAFCGGQPYFADPQSGYYSLLQWLTFVTDPLSATYLTLLLFASVGFFGTYLLARRHFGLALPWAILAAALYFFNGFLPHRMIIGHLGYPALTLAPWLALALLPPAASRVSTIGFSILAGLIAATWLQSGLTTLMLPAALSVALILLVYRLRQPWPSDLLPRMLMAVGISLVLSASKLVASLAFYSRFERTQYLLPGFDNPLALLVTNLLALFGPSEAAAAVANAWLVNAQWTLFAHEWAFGFTVVPLFVLFRARVLLRRRTDASATTGPGEVTRGGSARDKGMKIAAALAILAIALIPLALQFYTPAYNAWLKALPLVGATAAPERWLIVYLPVLPIAIALLGSLTLARQGQEDQAPKLVFSFILMLIAINVAEPRRYYFKQGYQPAALLAAYERLAAGGAASQRIKAIGLTTPADAGAGLSGLTGNDVMIAGISQMRCYNPSFGYRLEHLPPAKLEVGDVLAERDGLLNIRNPACFVFPEENGCQPGGQFRADQRAEAEAFVAYAPFPFNKSRAQRVADGVTMGGLVGTAIFLGVAWPLLAWRRRKGLG